MVDGKAVAKKADGSKPPAARSPPKAWRWTRHGNIYGAEVGPRKLQRYVKK